MTHFSLAASLKTFGIRLEEVLVNELTRRKQRELTPTMQVEDINGSTGRRRRGNVVQRMLGRMRRFFSRRRNEPTLPREFTRRGRRVSSVLEVSGMDPQWKGVKACVLMVWGLVLPQRNCQVLHVTQQPLRSVPVVVPSPSFQASLAFPHRVQFLQIAQMNWRTEPCCCRSCSSPSFHRLLDSGFWDPRGR